MTTEILADFQIYISLPLKSIYFEARLQNDCLWYSNTKRVGSWVFQKKDFLDLKKQNEVINLTERRTP